MEKRNIFLKLNVEFPKEFQLSEFEHKFRHFIADLNGEMSGIISGEAIPDLDDLSKLKKVYDELGIEYHELIEGEYTYIQKFSAHDKPGYLGVMGGLYPLKTSGQLSNFLEFENGKLVSW